MPPVTLYRERTTVEELPKVCVLCGEPAVNRRSYALRSDPAFSEKLHIRFPLCRAHDKPYGQLAMTLLGLGLALVFLGAIGLGVTIMLEKSKAPPPADGEVQDFEAWNQPVVPKAVNAVLVGLVIAGIVMVGAHNFVPGFPVVAAKWTSDSVTIGPVDERFIRALKELRRQQPPSEGVAESDDPFNFT